MAERKAKNLEKTWKLMWKWEISESEPKAPSEPEEEYRKHRPPEIKGKLSKMLLCYIKSKIITKLDQVVAASRV